MEDLSPKAKAAWEHVCSDKAVWYETIDPEGYRELVDCGLLEEVKQERSRVAFKPSSRGLLAKDYAYLMNRLDRPQNFMPGDAVLAIRHILVRLGPPV